MRYLGGKTRLAKPIVNAILADTDIRENWIEPFVGGGSVLEQAVKKFQNCTAGDASEDLILCWSSLSNGWKPPRSISEETYEYLKHDEPSALRGYVGYACSFGGKWFGGYPRDRTGKRDMIDEAYRATMRKASAFVDVEWHSGDYESIRIPGKSVVYCDPPYANTTGYSSVGEFDHKRFWSVMDKWVDLGHTVYVSELDAPDHWYPILEVKRKVGRCMTVNGDGNNSQIQADCLFSRSR